VVYADRVQALNDFQLQRLCRQRSRSGALHNALIYFASSGALMALAFLRRSAPLRGYRQE
jgi:hypothetical protein